MCGRYLFISEEDELKELLYLASFGSGVELEPNDLPNGDISPGMRAFVITGFGDDGAENGKRRIKAEMALWGIPMIRKSSLIINSRREKVMSSPIFSRLLDTGRCLIPASGYYEWKRESYTEKQSAGDIQLSLFGAEQEEEQSIKRQINRKYLFTLPGKKTLYMAGLYDHYRESPRFTIITGAAVGRAADIHQRMPLILTGDNINTWLNGGSAAAELLSAAIPEPVYRPAV